MTRRGPRLGKVVAYCGECRGQAVVRGTSPPSIRHEPGCRLVLSHGQLVRARRQAALQLNTVFVDDGRVLTVRGAGSIDRCPSCGTEGAQVGILSDTSLFHSMPDGVCDAVFPPEP